MFEFFSSVSEHALVTQLSRGDRRQVSAVPLELADMEGIGPELRRLHDEFGGVGEQLLTRAPLVSDQGFDAEARGLVDRIIRPVYKMAIEGTRRATAEVDKKAEQFFSPEFGPDADPAVQAAQHTWWRGLSMPQQLEAAKDLEIARVAVKFGQAMSTLPPDVFQRLRRDMAVQQLAQRIARDADLRKAPTPNDPIGGAVDMATARENAAKAFDRWDGERELLALTPKTLTDFIDATATLTGESRQAAFQRLSA